MTATAANSEERSERVLVLMTNRADAQRTVDVLAAAGVEGVACDDGPALHREMEHGVGALLVTEEAVAGDREQSIRAALAAQPAWSAVPVVAVVREGAAVGRRESFLADFSANVTLIERPLRMRTLVSVVRGAVRARRHQYDIRDAIAERELALDAARLGWWRYAPAAGLVTHDERYAEIYGLADDGLAGRGRPVAEIAALLHPEDAPRVWAAVEAATNPVDSKPYVVEYRVNRPDGALRWLEAHGLAAFAGEGAARKAVSFVGTVADVTDRKQAEEVLRASEQRYRALAMASSDVAYRMSADWSVMFPLDGRGLVASNAEPIRDWLPRNIPPEEHDRIRAAIAQVIAGSSLFDLEHRVIRADGSVGWTRSRAVPILDDAGEVIEWFGAASDITDRKRAEQALRESEDRYRTLFASMDEGYCVIEVLFDPPGGKRAVDYRFLEVNPAFEAQAGMPNPVGRRMLEFVPSIEDHWLENYGRVALSGEPVRFANEYKTLDRWFDVYAFRVGRPDERKVAVLFSDITARKESEARVAALVESLREQDKRKDEFLATLAHELRNPLAPIRSGLAVLAMSPLEGPAAELVPMMERQLAHLVHLVDDLLDVSRVTSGRITLHRERFDLREAVSAAIETCRPAIACARHAFAARLPETPVFVDGDATRLAQVVTNLLTNACKYTPDGGRIELAVTTQDDTAVIRVEDDGVGIPADMLPKVFDTFTQVGRSLDRSQGGLGLGLALVRRLVEKHGGKAEVESPGPDRGSTFTVRLPLAAAPETSTLPEPPAEPSPAPLTVPPTAHSPRRHRILVVDDLRPSAATLAMMLKALGQDARAENDGASALRVAAEFRPQVVISDIGMPGMDGYEVARRFRAADGPRPVLVALTGYGQDEDRRRAFDAGFDHHLVKPTSVDALRQLLASLPPLEPDAAAHNGSPRITTPADS